MKNSMYRHLDVPVRCINCIYQGEDDVVNTGRSWCNLSGLSRNTDPMDFCMYGEDNNEDLGCEPWVKSRKEREYAALQNCR